MSSKAVDYSAMLKEAIVEANKLDVNEPPLVFPTVRPGLLEELEAQVQQERAQAKRQQMPQNIDN